MQSLISQSAFVPQYAHLVGKCNHTTAYLPDRISSPLYARHKGSASLQRRIVLLGTTLAVSATVHSATAEVPFESDALGNIRLAYRENGYQTWNWRGHKVNYVVAGEENKDAIVLVHGFGASVYHWRYNIPELSRKFKVYAVDLLGFGWSDKALVEYTVALWGDQLADFLREVVQQPAVLAGNSVGGYSVLATGSFHPELVRGLILLNAAGRFEEVQPENQSGDSSLVRETPGIVGTNPGNSEGMISKLIGPLKKAAQRALLYLTFLQAKQPNRIRQVLNSVYPDSTNVDDVLVNSIVAPAQDPNAVEVYYRLTSQVLLTPASLSLNSLLGQLRGMPVLLLWGDLDPWMTPSKAEQLLALYPPATKVGLLAGHCPHDEKPKAVNSEIDKWMASLPQP